MSRALYENCCFYDRERERGKILNQQKSKNYKLVISWKNISKPDRDKCARKSRKVVYCSLLRERERKCNFVVVVSVPYGTLIKLKQQQQEKKSLQNSNRFLLSNLPLSLSIYIYFYQEKKHTFKPIIIEEFFSLFFFVSLTYPHF